MIALSGDKRNGKYYLNSKLLDNSKILKSKILDRNSGVGSKVAEDSFANFTHGYKGMGSSNLSLAILMELTDEDTAINNTLKFRNEVIANIKEDDFHALLIDDSEYTGNIYENPFEMITDRDVYVYRELYYETWKKLGSLVNQEKISRETMDEEMKFACVKFGWNIEYYNMMHSIDWMQRLANKSGKIKKEKVLITVDGEEKTVPIYDVMEFPQLQCPIRTENKSTLWTECQ